MCTEKLTSLMPLSGAEVTVVAPWICDEVRSYVESGRVRWIEKEFEPSDCDPFFMIIAATNDPLVNALVFETGDKLLRLTNSVDDPKNCNFIMAAIARSGLLQVAVSSAGASPAIAQRVRARIQNEILTPDLGVFMEYLGSWRPVIKKALPNYRSKQVFWETVIDSDLQQVLRSKGKREADIRFRQVLKDFVIRSKQGYVWQ